MMESLFDNKVHKGGLSMNSRRRRYSLEFKLEAVRLANESGRSKTQIARELDISRPMLYSWCNAHANKGKAAFKANEGTSAEQQEIKRLQLENKRLREDREILKKAAAYFARELR